MNDEIHKFFAPFIVERRKVEARTRPQVDSIDDGKVVGSSEAARQAGMTTSAFQSALQAGRVRGAWRDITQVGMKGVWRIPTPVVVAPPKPTGRGPTRSYKR